MENQTNDYRNREFMIFNVSELSKIDFNMVIQSSELTIRRSVDNTKTFVKWVGDIPDCVNGLETKQGPYSHNEMFEILQTNEWKNLNLFPNL